MGKYSNTIGALNNDYALSAIRTADGGFALAGCAYGSGLDASVVKLGPDGFLVWASAFRGASHDWFCSIVQTTDRTYAIAGYTQSFGAGNYDIDSAGNYPGCVEHYYPTVADVSPSAHLPSVGAECYHSAGIPDLTITSPSLAITDPCSPVDLSDVDPNGSNSRGICCAIHGTLLFFSSEKTEIKIYSPDGRLAYSGELQKGENRITLGRGSIFGRRAVIGGRPR